jgi:hypothetical protein
VLRAAIVRSVNLAGLPVADLGFGATGSMTELLASSVLARAGEVLEHSQSALSPPEHDYAAYRRVISAKAAWPSSVNEYGALNSWPVFFTSCLRFRY